MGTNTLQTLPEGTSITVDGINQYKKVLAGDIVPRNSDGTPEDIAGALGTDVIEWLGLAVASGFWAPGDLKPHHTYNGIATVNQGWYPCDGSVVNETNYNAIYGAGSWATYIVTSIFDGKYSPNLTDKYLVGAASTGQDGSGAITSVGNADHEISVEHTHTVNAHNHQWLIGTGGATRTLNTVGPYPAQSYNSSGALVDYESYPMSSKYTSNSSPVTDARLATDQSIRPESIEVIYYMRLI